MKQNEFKPEFRDDGTLDPVCLEQAGLRWVKQWLEARFSGHDPYFPIDKHVDEDPDALVVAILRDAGLAHPASDLISQAVLRMLDEARATAPKTLAFFSDLLRLCQRIRIPQAGRWFAEELQNLATASQKTEDRWGSYEQTKEIVFAAIVQAPGMPTSGSQGSWLALLAEARYATLALLGLGMSFQEQASHLKEWWVSCRVSERQQELNQLFFTALKTEGEESVLSILKPFVSSFPRDLRDAVDAGLQANGAKPAFAEPVAPTASLRSLWRAVSGAARKPQLVLAEA